MNPDVLGGLTRFRICNPNCQALPTDSSLPTAHDCASVVQLDAKQATRQPCSGSFVCMNGVDISVSDGSDLDSEMYWCDGEVVRRGYRFVESVWY